MPIEVRNVLEEEFAAWSDAMDVGFHNPGNRGDGPRRRQWSDIERCWGAFEEGAAVATLRGIPLELTVPGGIPVRADGVSAVTVLPTRRRRGLLTRMMHAELAAAVGRGESLAVLVAAEYPIYGRFGFGPAAETANLRLDARAARFPAGLPGRIELVDAEQAAKLAPAVYDQVRLATPGAISRTQASWDRDFGLMPRDGAGPDGSLLFAVCYNALGEPVGFACYSLRERWYERRPDGEARVVQLFATSLAYEARLWQFLAEHDWVGTVWSEEWRRPDELWRDLLGDRRAAVCVEPWDALWLRVLDPAEALSRRRYEVPGRIVLRVTDPDGYAEGVFALDGGPDGASCTRTIEPPQVTLSVHVLSSIYLGGYSAVRFALQGRIDEHEACAVARLAAMFHTALAPWPLSKF